MRPRAGRRGLAAPAALLFVSLSLLGCGERASAKVDLVRLAGRTMGTTWEVLLPRASFDKVAAAEPLDASLLQDRERGLEQRIQKELDAVNASMSTYLADSELSRFNALRSTDWVPVSAALASVVQTALEVGVKSRSALDVTVGPLVDAWGFGPKGRRREPPAAGEVEAARARCGAAKLEVRLDPPALRKLQVDLEVDLSSTAKGHGVDRVLVLLEGLGFKAAWVEVGGEVRACGVKAEGVDWRVAIEAPSVLPERRVQETLALRDLAVATSGDYRNFFEHGGERYVHILDPRSGWPTRNVAQASVWAKDCASADAWATAMVVLGEEAALEVATEQGLALLLILRDPRSTANEPRLRTVVSPTFEALRRASSTPKDR